MPKPVGTLRFRFDASFQLRFKPPRRETWWIIITIALTIGGMIFGHNVPIELIR